MGNPGLTRQEISWLLAEEAKSAARTLRDRVADEPEEFLQDPSIPVPSDPCEALSDAVAALAILTDPTIAGPPSSDGRRSSITKTRVDLASLLCEMSPSAKVHVEPGRGTEVIGDPDELRRMLHVMMHQAHSMDAGRSSPVSVHREAEWVRVDVDLGPDVSAAVSMDQRWLSRTALRHAGRLELHGSRQTLWLPAGGAAEREQIANLRIELDQAQKLGAAYAQALGENFKESTGKEGGAGSPLEGAALIAASLGSVIKETLSEVQKSVGELQPSLSRQPKIQEKISAALGRVSGLAAELQRLAEGARDEAEVQVDVAAALRTTVEEALRGSSLRPHQVRVEAPEHVHVGTYKAALGMAMRALIDAGVAATPASGEVFVALRAQGDGFVLEVEDGGPLVNDRDFSKLLRAEIDPSSLGRPTGSSLVVAGLAADRLGASLSTSSSRSGRQRTVFEL